ncbi:MAG: biotin--[acetyl-CoA-carboxylase] ligase, partial [Chloroflexi bacterium]|nr:biotin--[acetyl-CoA-carboxylase] ligase [Chloroflexota bacterium]
MQDKLKTRFIGRELKYVETATSTQDVAKELAEQGAAEGTAVIAGQQRSGRGRMGRSWLSPAGGLATSIILRPSMASVYLLPAICSLAVYRTLGKLGIKAGIKWPNDVLIQGKKACGILIEHSLTAGELRYSIVGIGINVNFDTGSYPEIADIATSLSAQLGRELSIAEVTLRLYTELEAIYTRTGEPDRIIDEWSKHMVTIGQMVSADFHGSRIDGRAEGVNRQGNLVVRLSDRSIKEIVAGDVTI